MASNVELRNLLDKIPLDTSPLLGAEGTKDRDRLLVISTIAILVSANVITFPQSPEVSIFGAKFTWEKSWTSSLLLFFSSYLFIAFLIHCYRSWQRWKIRESLFGLESALFLQELVPLLEQHSSKAKIVATDGETLISDLTAALEEKRRRDERLRQAIPKALEESWRTWEGMPSILMHSPGGEAEFWPIASYNVRRVIEDIFPELSEDDKEKFLNEIKPWCEVHRTIEGLVEDVQLVVSGWINQTIPDFRPQAHDYQQREAVLEKDGRQLKISSDMILSANHEIEKSLIIGFIWDLTIPSALYAASAAVALFAR